MTLETLSADDFRECLKQTFRIRAGEELLAEASLIDVRALQGHASREGKTSFSVLFHTPDDAPLEQSIYRLENDTMGGLDLFLVCVGPDPDEGGMCYEAVFT